MRLIYTVSKAFILMNCDLGTEGDIMKALSTRKGVSFVYKTQGVYDLIMKLELGSADELRRNIQDIRRIDNVRSSLTMIIAED